MFDFGIWELMTIIIIAILVMRPEDIPEMFKAFGKAIRKMKALTQEFSQLMDKIIDEPEFHDIKGQIVDLEGNLQNTYEIEPEKKKAHKADD